MEHRTPLRRKAKTRIREQQKQGETNRLDRHWRSLFIDMLADTSNVSAAARAAGINPARAYKVRRREADFARQWYGALREGYENLEMETLYRLRHGTAAEGPKFDTANALRLLALHRDTVNRERARMADADEEAVLASLNAKLEKMNEREEALESLLAEDGVRKVAEADGA